MSLARLLSRLDRDPKRRGDEFERICAWYLRNAPEYGRRFRKVWLWADWPGVWAADAGIDLIAEEHDGGLWAIQAKAYDERYAIKKSDVDSFLSESSRPGITYRLLIATTDRLGPTAKRTLDDQREPVGYLLRSQLELAEVPWPASPDELRPRRPARKKPFPHVKEAIMATVKGFDSTDRGQLLMACGTGKTLTAMWIAERLDSKRTLILLPSLSLLAQTLREWIANASKPFDDYLAVCSDATVAGEDQFVAHTSELGLPVTTAPEQIATFLRRRGRRVVFATYQSSPQVAAAFAGRTPGFDLAIADEAHRCAGRTSTEFATILDREQIRARRRLFMTATPRLYTPRVLHEAGQLDVDIASMDDEAVFGPVLHRLSFGEAIERDLLSDYQVVVVGVDDETYRTYAEDGEFVTQDGIRITDARTLAGQIGLGKTMRKYDLRRVLSFHGRVKAAREFSTAMPEVVRWMPARARPSGQLWSNHVSGAMTSGHRDRLLLRFRDLATRERGLLSNARCLGEGVDVPSIDGVAFIDPRRSTIDIVQALGRAIRKTPDKKLGTIVLPVFISGDEDPEQVLDESAFKHVWDVLKALRAHDESLGEELDELRRRLGARQSAPRRPGKIKLDVPAARVGNDFVRAFNARLVEQTTASWEFYFGLLQRFVEREGHARPPARWREDGYRLGGWVDHQRQRRAGLSAARIRLLESLPKWVWDADQAAWEDGLGHLERFVDREGHSRVPYSFEDGEGYPLGSWVATQRRYRKRGELTEKRARQLESLPKWVWDANDAAWEDGFTILQRFLGGKGHGRLPPKTWVEDGYRLGGWISEQRVAYRRRTLSRERRARLEALPGWTWDLNEVKGAGWEEGFARLERFVQREGHGRVPQSWIEDGYQLGSWIARQRRRYRKGTLEANRRARLEGVPGWTWEALEAAWEEGFVNLERFVKREGHAQVPRGHREDGQKLDQWVLVQRQTYRKGILNPQRRVRLEALPGWTWDPHATAWEDAYVRLRNFADREGHAQVPFVYQDADGYKLGGWVNVQRTSWMRRTLRKERAERLEALPGWTWEARKAGARG